MLRSIVRVFEDTVDILRGNETAARRRPVPQVQSVSDPVGQQQALPVLLTVPAPQRVYVSHEQLCAGQRLLELNLPPRALHEPICRPSRDSQIPKID